MKRWKFDLHSLAVQIVLSSVALVLLTAAAAGLPAIWLVRGQLNQQAWQQVEHGSRAAQALYAATRKEMDSLATLSAQRPTLRGLLAQGTQEDLAAYLLTLQQGSRLDLVAVCGEGHAIALAGETILAEICTPSVRTGFVHVATDAGAQQAWLLAAQPLGDGPREVWVGQHLDDAFAAQIREQTGLEHTFLPVQQGGLTAQGLPTTQVLASSLASREQTPTAAGEALPPGEMELDGHEYYTHRFPLPPGELQVEVALEVTELSATLRRAAWSLGGSIVGVVLVASLLGTILARRISAPLARLARAASGISRGDGPSGPDQALESPWPVQARVREIRLVAQALEAGQQDLRQSLEELHQEKAWVEHLLESIVEGIVTLDRHGHITFFSHGAERITGWQRDEVLGRTCDQIFRPTETDEPFSHLIPSPGGRRKIPVELRDRRHVILAVTGARLLPPAGQTPSEARVALVFRDVSEEEAVHRLLGRFLANVAHEFRTPLSALAASAELLLDQAPELSPAELEELLSSLHLAVLGLQTLIDNLLEGASIESGHFRVNPRLCNPSDVIAEAIGTMQPLLDKHSQSLVIELPAAVPLVRADPRRTVQVLINLLSNASKYGPDAADIEISAAVDDEWVRISVADRGPGVPPDQRQELFRPFVHPRPGNDKAEVGVGLGLSVAKAIVEGQDGEVGVEGRPGGGSIFWFTLPREGAG